MGQLGEHSDAKLVASKVFFSFKGSVTCGTKNQKMPPWGSAFLLLRAHDFKLSIKDQPCPIQPGEWLHSQCSHPSVASSSATSWPHPPAGGQLIAALCSRYEHAKSCVKIAGKGSSNPPGRTEKGERRRTTCELKWAGSSQTQRWWKKWGCVVMLCKRRFPSWQSWGEWEQRFWEVQNVNRNAELLIKNHTCIMLGWDMVRHNRCGNAIFWQREGKIHLQNSQLVGKKLHLVVFVCIFMRITGS